MAEQKLFHVKMCKECMKIISHEETTIYGECSYEAEKMLEMKYLRAAISLGRIADQDIFWETCEKCIKRKQNPPQIHRCLECGELMTADQVFAHKEKTGCNHFTVVCFDEVEAEEQLHDIEEKQLIQ